MNKLYLSKKCLPIPSFKIIRIGIAVLISVVQARGQNEVSVDKFTGTAHVSIPLCAVQNRGVALSLGLHYIASGVPVDEIGTSAGVNWAFTGVPAISREVRDLPDDLVLDAGATEKRYGWIMPSAVVSAKVAAVPLPSAASPCTGTESSTTVGAFQQTSTNPQAHEIFDAEPDVFSYSLPGHNGKFVFDEQRNIRLIPYDNVTITYVRGTDQALESFEVFTPEGHKYVFDVQDATAEISSVQPNQPQFFRRRYESNKAYTTYCAAWHVSHIYAPQLASGTGNSALGLAVSFEYLPISDGGGRQSVEQLFWPGVISPQTLYATSIIANRNLLTRISTDNQAIDLGYNTSGYGNGGGPLSVLYVSALSNGIPTVVKHIDLLYSSFSPGFYLDRPYYDQYGTALSEVANAIAHRNFLTEVRTANDCMTFASYTFAYNTPSALPPIGCAEQDYWGYFNGNRATTMAPQLFVYPQLDPSNTPGGPYRLFDIPSLTGGLTLPGADRRPPQTLQDFQATTLAGTLSSVTLPTGGTVAIEYEPHRFYEPLAQSYRNGAGVRAKAVRIKDNISGVEQVREYQYQQNNGESSGRLLHIPRFAITAPTTTTNGTPLSQWTASTVVSVTDLASDPFETRDVGYSRVIEKVAGRGKSTYTFALNALPEDAVAAGYTRTTTGLTRQLTPQCPTTGLYQPGAEVYPFPQLTNYGHERGNLLSVSHETEPNSGGTSQVVQSESFTYGYVPMPSSVNVQVHGVAYEKLLDQGNIYAYGKYSLQTGFVYALLNRSTTDADQTQSTRTLTEVV